MEYLLLSFLLLTLLALHYTIRQSNSFTFHFSHKTDHMSAAVATADPAFMANLPPLPDIASTDIARRVVTHPSLNGEPTQSFEFPENMAQDYRRDAVSFSRNIPAVPII